MTPSDNADRPFLDGDGERFAEDVAALAHFSAYIAKEARRLGLPAAAEKARVVQSELLLALEHG